MRLNLSNRKKGVSLKPIQIFSAILALILAVGTCFALIKTHSNYYELSSATEQYHECEKSASDLRSGSEYLTTQVRLFSVTGDIRYLDNYFEELEVTRTRENAVEVIKKYFSDSNEYKYLKSALDDSDELVLRECYSMRLTAEGFGHDISALPAKIKAVELNVEDGELDEEGKKALAVSMVFDEVYENYKDKIDQNTSLCLDTILIHSRENQAESRENLFGMLVFQETLIVILIIIVILMAVLTMKLIIGPIKQGVEMIRQGKRIPVSGANEMRFLAQTYNKMYDETMKTNEILSFEATHDELTGVYNHAAFVKVMTIGGWEKTAFIIIDVDKFKIINDTYGHQTGDRVLNAVGDALKNSFRSGDFVCRFGGDEFAVIMIDVDESMKPLVERKIKDVMKKISAREDIPKETTISAGVAFGNWKEESETIINNADKALYKVKNSGRNGLGFYSAHETKAGNA